MPRGSEVVALSEHQTDSLIRHKLKKSAIDIIGEGVGDKPTVYKRTGVPECWLKMSVPAGEKDPRSPTVSGDSLTRSPDITGLSSKYL